jgi:signal transduction histidine kinase
MEKSRNEDRTRMRVRARAVDMLGRQQIAGIPTAIHELFKNAHDAYADHAEVDYFRNEAIFILRDDGTGMTKSDFEQKWLTLGTESKVGINRKTGFIPTGKVAREITGEKGIGRLAIATIGRQALILTRAIRDDGLSNLTVALIHWSLFEVPGIDIEEVAIPIITVEGGLLPSRKDIKRLSDLLRENILELELVLPTTTRDTILQDLERLNFDFTVLEKNLGGLSLREDGHGTQFYIFATDPILQNDIDNGRDDEASNLEKTLLGFSNTMYSETAPVMLTAFRDHRGTLGIFEILANDAFFTPQEFELADQHIEGDFDEYGQFQGFVSVYHRPAKNHIIRWSNGSGGKTECGPFRIRFAYLQGLSGDSLVPVDMHADLYAKTNKIGGLYIYRDGIRILPYGRADYDFLEMENRRSKSAKDAYFSYRRVYGAVEVSYSTNPNLIEKAGREGFRENKAYRQMREILINFFKQLALDFFAPNASDNDFLTQKTEIQRQAAILKNRENQIGVRKKKFATALNEFFEKLQKNYFFIESQKIEQELRDAIEKIRSGVTSDIEEHQILDLEIGFKRKLAALRSQTVIARPRDIGFAKSILSDWDAYQKNRSRIEQEIFAVVEINLDDMISRLTVNHVNIDRRRRVGNQLEDGKKVVQKKGNILKKEVGVQINLFQNELQAALQKKIGNLNGTVEKILIEFERTEQADFVEDKLSGKQREWEKDIDIALEETEQYLSALSERLKDLTDTLSRGEILDVETLGAIENQSDGYKTQLDTYFEFAQVGMAVGIVQHEFSSTIKQIRGCIKQLKPWADGTPELKVIYGDMRHNFEHLDSYLTLFAPLNRRLHRSSKKISGYEILRYLMDVFGERLERHNIKIVHSLKFDTHSLIAYPSTIFPVFVNIVDNAVFWLNSTDNQSKTILLDSIDDDFVISNSGPSIELRDAEAIFDFGVTRKSGGRGMGLYISRESLRRDEMDLELVSTGGDGGVTFRILTKLS